MGKRSRPRSLSEGVGDVTETHRWMKKKLVMVAQVLVSVFILAYLFNSIFEREAGEELKVIATDVGTAETALAAQLRLPVTTIHLLRSRCVMADGSFDLKQLPLSERAGVAWRVGPRGLWEVLQQVEAGWLVLAVLCSGAVCLLGIIRWRLILDVQGLKLSLARTDRKSTRLNSSHRT